MHKINDRKYPRIFESNSQLIILDEATTKVDTEQVLTQEQQELEAA